LFFLGPFNNAGSCSPWSATEGDYFHHSCPVTPFMTLQPWLYAIFFFFCCLSCLSKWDAVAWIGCLSNVFLNVSTVRLTSSYILALDFFGADLLLLLPCFFLFYAPPPPPQVSSVMYVELIGARNFSSPPCQTLIVRALFSLLHFLSSHSEAPSRSLFSACLFFFFFEFLKELTPDFGVPPAL